ncbi:hypothetical protein KSP40_PGU019356 [Platanthera guangdongensis]|uniref:At5g58720/SDE5-like UBA-like domain-containing protein n=1 Tax=Platanthera guangdongensis TaxID=2320717 RepID=A0ABR2LCR1_9ASPA
MTPTPSRGLLPDADAKPSHFCHKSPESLVGDAGEIEETEDPGKRSLHLLNSFFPLLSLIQIDSAYQESGNDAYKAAGILRAELVDPEESSNSYGKKRSTYKKKKKRVAASTGMVSGVIGKVHWKSTSSCSGRRRSWGNTMKAKE